MTHNEEKKEVRRLRRNKSRIPAWPCFIYTAATLSAGSDERGSLSFFLFFFDPAAVVSRGHDRKTQIPGIGYSIFQAWIPPFPYDVPGNSSVNRGKRRRQVVSLAVIHLITALFTRFLNQIQGTRCIYPHGSARHCLQPVPSTPSTNSTIKDIQNASEPMRSKSRHTPLTRGEEKFSRLSNPDFWQEHQADVQRSSFAERYPTMTACQQMWKRKMKEKTKVIKALPAITTRAAGKSG